LQVFDRLLVREACYPTLQVRELRARVGVGAGVGSGVFRHDPRMRGGGSARILVVEWGNAGGWKAIALHLPLAIGRIGQRPTPATPAARRAGPRLFRRNPTRLIGGTKPGVVVERVDLPDTLLFPVVDFVNALGPYSAAAKAAYH